MGGAASVNVAETIKGMSDADLKSFLAGLAPAQVEKMKAALSKSTGMAMRPMGKQGLVTSMQGYGAMGLTAFYGPSMQEADAVAVLDHAYKLGVRHFDSAEMYAGKDANGADKHNETAVGQFVSKIRKEDPGSSLTFATKYFPSPDNPEKFACKPECVRKAVEDSLGRLGLSCIDLYYLHRIPMGVDGALESWMNTCKELIAEGKIKYLGLSEATPSEIRLAHSIHPITAVQQEWSLIVRNLEVDVVPTCRELGIGIVAYSPLCRGFTSAMVKSDKDWDQIGTGTGKFQNRCPHLSGDNLTANAKLLAPLEEAAAAMGKTPAELSLAWVQAQGEDVFPIPGTTKTKNLDSNVSAAHLSLTLSKDTLEKIAPTINAYQGDRYPEMFMGFSYEKKEKQ